MNKKQYDDRGKKIIQDPTVPDNFLFTLVRNEQQRSILEDCSFGNTRVSQDGLQRSAVYFLVIGNDGNIAGVIVFHLDVASFLTYLAISHFFEGLHQVAAG